MEFKLIRLENESIMAARYCSQGSWPAFSQIGCRLEEVGCVCAHEAKRGGGTADVIDMKVLSLNTDRQERESAR